MQGNAPIDSAKSGRAALERIVARHSKPSRWRSNWQLINSIIPYLALNVAMYFTLSISYWLTLGLAVIAAGFLIRIFIIFHDCGHGSFFRSKRANNFWGAVAGVLTFTPYYTWKKRHAEHHATSGDLDRRGVGDVWTMTVKEYIAATRAQRAWYRFYRHPLVLFVLGPLQVLLIQNRRILPGSNRKDVISVVGTNLSLAIIVAAVWLTVGIEAYLLIQLPIILIGLALGIWLFYVQHQFEGVYWERGEKWDFVAASLEGSSYYKLPKIFQWFSGNIGFHHVHHLNSRVPNYRLEDCHHDLTQVRPIPEVGLFRSLRSLKFRLWDEDRRQLISFRQFRKLRLQPTTE